MTHPSLTVAARRQRVAEMREAGMSQVQIARTLGVHSSTIEIDCLVMGASAPGQRARRREIRPCFRKGQLVRSFTPEEDARLSAMSEAGETYAAMERALGRSWVSCRSRLYVLARREALAEVK